MALWNWTASNPQRLFVAWAILTLLLVWLATFAEGLAYGFALVILFTLVIQYQRTQ